MSTHSSSVVGDAIHEVGGGDHSHDSPSLSTLHLLKEAKHHVKSGMSRRQSESWHKRLYGGMGDATKLMAVEIGAAAGLEAWIRHYRENGHELGHESERMLRMLVAAAAAEVEKHWSNSGRQENGHGKEEALLAAAAMAMKFFYKGHHKDRHEDYHEDHEDHHEEAHEDHHGRRRFHRPKFLHKRSSSVPPDLHSHRGASSSSASSSASSDSDSDSTHGGRSRSRSSRRHGYHKSSVLKAALPIAAIALEAAHHKRRRAKSHSRHARPLEHVMGDLALGSSHHSRRRDYDYDYGYEHDHGYPSSSHGYPSSSHGYPSSSHGYPSPSHGYYPHHSRHHDLGRLIDHERHYGHHGHHGRHSDLRGVPVQREIAGDPYSEFGHLPPGTYVVHGGSSGRRRRRHSGGLRHRIGDGVMY